MTKFKPVLVFLGIVSAVGIAVAAVTIFRVNLPEPLKKATARAKIAILQPKIERKQITAALGDVHIRSNLLKLDYLPLEIEGKFYQAQLTLDKDLQEKVEDLYDRYSPYVAAFVAMDPETGKILALVDYSSDSTGGNIALKAPYPAASVFKVVTSAAALEQKKIAPKTVIPVNGGYSTLYKKNLKEYVNRWTRFITIEEAFAKSVNTVFAKIALNRVGPDQLQHYANNFGFNQHIDFDLPFESGSAIIPKDEFGLAESGSGYTKRQTLNPIQAAMIASSIVNEGKMPAPYLVESVTTSQGVSVYQANHHTLSQPVDKNTAQALSLIMENTITQGTGRKAFRDYNHNPILSQLFIGAKTGSLSGDAPRGKYDWFVGFAQSSTNPKKKIAFASMIVNQDYWKVKSAHIAREVILEYFSSLKRKDI